MKRIFRMIVNIIIYLIIYMIMQFVVGYSILIFVMLKDLLLGKDMSFMKNKVEQLLLDNTSPIIIIAIALSMIAYIIIFALERKSLFKECGFKALNVKQFSMIILLGAGLDMIINSVLSFIPVDKWFPSHQEIVNSITAGRNFTLTLITVGIAVPIFEELLMRGMVFNELRRNMNLKLAVILQALIFGVYHGNMLQFIYASILGIFLGIVYLWTDTLWAPITIHILFNSSNLILSKITAEINILVYMLIGAAIFAIGIRYLYLLTHDK
ncbi:CPBP family intramembrane metalloprotease [Clostridium sp. SYSU_GA19001]|uniref:CPBP family intramembrane glutamic endopeptidase n=1 Tax=Clostridium caldaquaticum TaxID=2940653 RepID=UPI0020777621|nr:type II CAAX endopeptidase family protein [Clostridium caldaquaticum]MCM8711832.1 CPBP family intramembrane metalloprotease [Clostridium caldaquaticum]